MTGTSPASINTLDLELLSYCPEYHVGPQFRTASTAFSIVTGTGQSSTGGQVRGPGWQVLIGRRLERQRKPRLQETRIDKRAGQSGCAIQLT